MEFRELQGFIQTANICVSTVVLSRVGLRLVYSVQTEL